MSLWVLDTDSVSLQQFSLWKLASQNPNQRLLLME
jgi:hypothetical protein